MKKKPITYIKYPLVLISLALCISGIRWLISSEPWMLDQIANEERLQMTFKDLFLEQENTTLSAYLTQIYRFLGLYVLGIGFILFSFTSNKFLEIYTFRKRFLTVLGILLFSNLALAYFWIPSSHFIYVMWAAIGLYCLGLYNHLKT
jgi:hypothetical protein|tara:strand:+ start:518 stop:958 length:441 start_codon:yes stop_codon:yes gene_type:complete